MVKNLMENDNFDSGNKCDGKFSIEIDNFNTGGAGGGGVL